MEVFSATASSWIYTKDSFVRIGNVPILSGFMYAAVGSFLASVSRTFGFRHTRYPPTSET